MVNESASECASVRVSEQARKQMSVRVSMCERERENKRD